MSSAGMTEAVTASAMLPFSSSSMGRCTKPLSVVCSLQPIENLLEMSLESKLWLGLLCHYVDHVHVGSETVNDPPS